MKMAGSKRITTFFSKIWITVLIHRVQGFVFEGIMKKAKQRTAWLKTRRKSFFVNIDDYSVKILITSALS